MLEQTAEDGVRCFGWEQKLSICKTQNCSDAVCKNRKALWRSVSLIWEIQIVSPSHVAAKFALRPRFFTVGFADDTLYKCKYAFAHDTGGNSHGM